MNKLGHLMTIVAIVTPIGGVGMNKDKAPKIYYADGEFFGLTENKHDHVRPIAFVEYSAYTELEQKLAKAVNEIERCKEIAERDGKDYWDLKQILDIKNKEIIRLKLR